MTDQTPMGLIVDIEGRITQFERALKKADEKQRKAAADMERRAKESAKKIDSAYSAIGAGAERGLGGVANLLKGRVGYQIGQVATQLGDVATQIGGGTSALRAFGTQAAQILGPFGTVGAIAGTAAAAILPMIAALTSTGDEAGGMKEKIDALKSSVDASAAATEAASVPLEQLRLKYKDLADEVRRASGIMAGFAAARAKRDALGAAHGLTAELGFDFKPAEIPQQWDGSVNPDRQRIAAQEAQKTLDRLSDKTGAVGDQLDVLRMALRRLDTSNDLDAIVRDAENLLSVIDGLTKNATEEQRTFLESWAQSISAVMNEASRQIETQAAEDARLVREYDQHTLQMQKLAADRQAAEKKQTEAKQKGDVEQVASMGRVITEIDKQIAKLNELAATSKSVYAQIVSDVKSAAAEFASGAFEYLTGSSPEQFVSDATISEKGLLNLIGQKESGGNYNAQWGGGKYSGGQHDFVNMTIREVLAIQRKMLQHPDNTANSSAVGKYQIVGTTLGGKGMDGSGGLVKSLGINLDELYSPAMQDRLATELIRQRRPQGVEGLRQEWTSLQKVSPVVINSALGKTPISKEDEAVATRRQQQIDRDTRSREQNAEAARQQSQAIQQTAQDAQFETTLIGRSVGEQARLRTAYELTNKLRAQGIDLNARMADSEMTYAEAINRSAEAAGRKAEAEAKAKEASAQSQDEAATAQQNIATGAEAMTNIFMSATEGAESLKATLLDLAKQILRNQILKLFSSMTGIAGPFGSMLAPPKGFSEGGYTGDGATLEPAGIVHRGEYVVSKAAVQRIGVGNLEALHRSARHGYSAGGLVGGAGRKAVAGVAQKSNKPVPVVNVTGGPITVNGGGGTPAQNADLANQIAKEQDKALRQMMRDEMIRQRRPGGVLA